MKTMKTNIFLTGTLLLAAACVSCDRIEETPAPADGCVRFTAAIGKQVSAAPQSRAAGSSWAAGDAIGIFMVANGTDRVAEAAANREHTTPDGMGNFIPAAGQNIYYPMDGSAVDFIAYYPYTEGAAIDGTLPVKTAGTQTDATQAAGDLLWARADNKGAGYRKSAAGKVDLRFTHRLAKITFRCRLDASVGNVDPNDIEVVLKGMNTVAEFSVKDGTVGNLSTPAEITPRRLNLTVPDIAAVFDAIVIPAEYPAEAVTAEFWIAGERFLCDDIAPVTFQPGKNHIYNVLVTRTGVQATGIIENWVDQTMPPITAD